MHVERPSSSGLPRVAAALALCLLWLVAWYWPTTQEITGIWRNSETYAHGLVVLPIFAWLVWRARARIGDLAPRPAAWPLLIVVAGGLLWLLGEIVSVGAARHAGFVVLAVGALMTVLGTRLVRILLFPLLFLFFAVPEGDFLLPLLMNHTADFTVSALRLSGVPVYQEGLFFVVPNGRWSVVEACSGIRYLIASLMLGALYAYLNYRQLWRRALFMAVALVTPIVANWLRAYFIVLLGYLSDNAIATGVDHLIYGWVFFGIVIVIMFWLGSLWFEREPAPTVVSPAAPAEPFGRWHGAILLVLALLTALLAWLSPRGDAVAAVPPVELTLPAPAAGWQAVPVESLSYWPEYRGFRAEARAAYRQDDGSAPVGVYVAWFAGQDEQHEMVGWGNSLVLAESGERVLMTNQFVARTPGEVRELKMIAQGKRLALWQWYRIGEHVLAKDNPAKLRIGLTRLAGQPDASAVIVLTTPDAELEPEAANIRLAAFWQAHGAALTQTLAKLDARMAGAGQ